jgi:hypothetical protein
MVLYILPWMSEHISRAIYAHMTPHRLTHVHKLVMLYNDINHCMAWQVRCYAQIVVGQTQQ